jgi:hypothetical protein
MPRSLRSPRPPAPSSLITPRTVKQPSNLIRRPLYPIHAAPTPTANIPPQSSARASQATPFLGAASVSKPSGSSAPTPGSANEFTRHRD